MEVNYMFGVNEHIIKHTNTVKRGYVIDAPGLQIRTGAPCLIFGNNKDKQPSTNKARQHIEPHKYIVVPFPSGCNCNPRCLLDNYEQALVVREFEETNFLDKITTITTSSIDLKEFIHGIDHVKNEGPLTFLINQQKQLQANLTEIIIKLSEIFKYKCLLYNKVPEQCPRVSGEEILLALSVIDLRQSLPIFNSNKVNGIILHGAITYPKRSKHDDKLFCSSEFFMLFSQFEENFVGIDGDKTNSYPFINTSGLINAIKNFGKYYIKIGELKTAESKKKEN